MKFTEHAKMRMVERNFTASMIEDAMEPLMKQGKWDQRNERLTLNTNTEEFHSFIESIASTYQKLRTDYLMLKRTVKKCRTESAQLRLAQLKAVYKKCRNKLANLKRLEHKCTSVLQRLLHLGQVGMALPLTHCAGQTLHQVAEQGYCAASVGQGADGVHLFQRGKMAGGHTAAHQLLAQGQVPAPWRDRQLQRIHADMAEHALQLAEGEEVNFRKRIPPSLGGFLGIVAVVHQYDVALLGP